MKPEHKAALKAGATVGVVGATLLAAPAPIAWAALTYATIKIGQHAYRDARQRGIVQDGTDDPDLFI